jgi:hypothetical protein
MQPSLRKLSVAGLAAAAIALAAAAPSSSTPSIAVSGDAVPTSATLIPRFAGGNVLFDGSGTHAWTGSFTGTSAVKTHLVIHSSGKLTIQAFVTFTGSTPCGSGTVRLAAAGNGAFPGPVTAYATTIDRADASVPIHANLDLVLFLTPAGAVLTYSGDAHCD